MNSLSPKENFYFFEQALHQLVQSRERKNASPERKNASPESENASPESENASPESKNASLESENASPESKNASPESKNASLESKNTSPLYLFWDETTNLSYTTSQKKLRSSREKIIQFFRSRLQIFHSFSYVEKIECNPILQNIFHHLDTFIDFENKRGKAWSFELERLVNQCDTFEIAIHIFEFMNSIKKTEHSLSSFEKYNAFQTTIDEVCKSAINNQSHASILDGLILQKILTKQVKYTFLIVASPDLSDKYENLSTRAENNIELLQQSYRKFHIDDPAKQIQLLKDLKTHLDAFKKKVEENYRISDRLNSIYEYDLKKFKTEITLLQTQLNLENEEIGELFFNVQESYHQTEIGMCYGFPNEEEGIFFDFPSEEEVGSVQTLVEKKIKNLDGIVMPRSILKNVLNVFPKKKLTFDEVITRAMWKEEQSLQGFRTVKWDRVVEDLKSGQSPEKDI